MRFHQQLDDYVSGVSQAIDDRRWEDATNGIRVLFELVSVLLEFMNDLAHAAHETGNHDSNSVLAFREDIDALYGAYSRIFRTAMARGVDRSVVGAVLYVPWGVAQRALLSGRPALSGRFFSAGREGSIDLVEKLDPEARVLASDRLTRFPTEFFRFVLGSVLREGKVKNLRAAVQVVRQALGYVGELAKRSIDRQDFDAFVAVADVLGALPPARDGGRLRRNEVVGAGELKDAMERLEISRNAVVLGIGAWVIRRCRNEPRWDPSEWLDALASRVSCPFLLLGFEDAQAFETQEAMGWDWWLLEGREGEVVQIDFGGFVDLAFIELLSRCGDTELSQPDDPSAVKQLGYHFGEQRLQKVLRDELEMGGPSQTLVANAEAVATRLQAIGEGLEERWDDIVTRSPVSQEKTQQFIEHVVIGWESGGSLRKIFAEFDAIDIRDEDANSFVREEWRGVNTLLDKENFVEGSNVLTDYLAEQYGRSIAQGQDHAAWSVLTKGEGIRVEVGSLLSKLPGFLDSSQETFLIVGNWPDAAHEILSSADFQFAFDALWEGEVWGHKVFQSWVDGSAPPSVLICTPKQLGTWVDWRPWLGGDLQVFDTRLKGRIREIDERVEKELRFSGDRPGSDVLARRVHFEAYARSAIELSHDGILLLRPEGHHEEAG